MNNNFILDGCDIDGDIIIDRRIVLERLENQVIADSSMTSLSESKDCRFCGMDLDCKYYFSKTGDKLCDVTEFINIEKTKKNRRK